MTPQQRRVGVLAVFELMLDSMHTPESETEVEGFSLEMAFADLDGIGLGQVFVLAQVALGAVEEENKRRGFA